MAAWTALKSAVLLSIYSSVAAAAILQNPSQLPKKTYDYIIVGGMLPLIDFRLWHLK
jgi:hypothetical protein